MVLQTDSAMIGGALEQAASSAARSLGLRMEPVFAYLANSIRLGLVTAAASETASGAPTPPERRRRARVPAPHEIPYSVVAALDPAMARAPTRDDQINLNEWAARDLGAKAGDPITLEYYVWKPDGNLHTETLGHARWPTARSTGRWGCGSRTRRSSARRVRRCAGGGDRWRAAGPRRQRHRGPDRADTDDHGGRCRDRPRHADAERRRRGRRAVPPAERLRCRLRARQPTGAGGSRIDAPWGLPGA